MFSPKISWAFFSMSSLDCLPAFSSLIFCRNWLNSSYPSRDLACLKNGVSFHKEVFAF